jgi:hypothetical protein
MRKVVWENDTALMDSDPFAGRFWTKTDNFTDSPWDVLKRGAWIQVPYTPKLGIFGGLPLTEYALAGQKFSPKAQGYVPAVWHDMHCIVSSETANVNNIYLYLRSSGCHEAHDHATEHESNP